MRTVQFAVVFMALLVAVSTEDWAGCPEGTKFDGWADIVSNSPCYNGGVRSNKEYVEGHLPYPVCCARIGRGRRAAFVNDAKPHVDAAAKPNITARTA